MERRHEDPAVQHEQVEVAVELLVLGRGCLAAVVRRHGPRPVLRTAAEALDDPGKRELVDHSLDAVRPAICQGDHVCIGVVGEHLAQRRADGRHAEHVAGKRAADAALVGGVIVPVRMNEVGDCLAEAVDGRGHAAADRLAEGDHVRLQSPGLRASAGPGTDRVRLVDDEQRAGLAGQAAQLGVVALVRQDDADVGEGGLGEDAGHVAGLERPLQRLEVVPLDDLGRHGWIDRRSGVPRLRPGHPVVDRDDRLVDRAVVAVVVDEDLRPPGDVPGQADGEPVGVGGGERQLPVLQAEASRELGGDPQGVLRRQHGGDTACGLRHDGGDGGLRGVTGHGTGVAEAEVDVLVPVHAGEPGAAGLGHVGREGARPARHPVHGDAVEHVRLRPLEELAGPGVARDEALVFARLECREPFAVYGRVHGQTPPS